jgi:glycosyltransferase involved in cell wall biosynthesis
MIRTVAHFIESTEFGGTEQALLHVLAGLDRCQWRPVLFHHPEPGLELLLDRLRELDVNVHVVPRMKGKDGILRMPKFLRELRRERPSVFHAHLNWPLACKVELVSAALARIPAVVATVQLFDNVPLRASLYVQQRLVATGVDRYIAVSHHVARKLCQTYGLPANKVTVIHNGIFLSPFVRPADTELRAKLGATNGRPIVLTLARLDQQKGHRYLLQAVPLVPDALFVFAGDGPERASLEAQARQLGLNDDRILFLGYRRDTPDLLACCDLFVLPSLFEGLPLSILEAMAASKPVIASAIGGNDEAVIHEETGLLVSPENPAALAQAIQRLLSDRPLAARLAATGKAQVQKKFSAEAMVQRVTEIYEQILCNSEETRNYQRYA